MRRIVRSLGLGLFSTVAFAWFSGALLAQDPVKVAPNNYKAVFENDSVRVCEVQAKAGDKIATHSHPDHLVYAVTAGKIKFSYPDGKSKEVAMKAGEAIWVKAETHATENLGAAEFKAVVFELKKPAVGGTPPKMSDADDQAKVAFDTTKVLLDNERVRLLESRVKAGGKVAKHSHPANLVYAVTEGKFKITTYPEGTTSEKTLAAGMVLWNDGITHAAENIGTTEGSHLILELKEQPKQAGK